VSPVTPQAPAFLYDTGLLSTNGSQHITEYVETVDGLGTNGYMGDTGGVNQMYSSSQWRTGGISVSNDVRGFQVWTELAVLALPRPTYPSFGDNNDINFANQLFPNPNYSLVDCKLYTNQAATTPFVPFAGHPAFYVNGFCTSSCYTPEEQISFSTGDEGILDAMNTFRTDLKTLTPSSTLGKIGFRTDNVASYTRELHDSTHVIFEIRTESGGLLRVTDKHPVLEGNGRIVEARSLKAGDKLIKADGSRDRVESVTKTTHFGKVYNIKPTSTNRVANILVAQGFLVGSSRFQNDDVNFINRIILGRSIPKDVIPQ
jgi:Pretoxin HINT domain